MIEAGLCLSQRLSDELSSSLRNTYDDNYDYIRFDGKHSHPRRFSWREAIKTRLRRHGVFPHSHVKAVLRNALGEIGPLLPRLENLNRQLEDEESRALLAKLLAFRCLGHRHVRLPLSTPDYWRGIHDIAALADKNDFIDPNFMSWKLYRTDLHSVGLPMSLYVTPKGAYTQLVLQQYRCQRRGALPILPTAGDVVIDCGGCWGDTALYFAHLVGERGSVLTYEFIPSNQAIIERNLELNPALARRINVVPQAVWDKSDLPVTYHDNGPGSSVEINSSNGKGTKVTTLSIDDLVARRRLHAVNFIKMDIEGAELKALQGAANTIATFRPTLAISVYHRFHDFVEIPEFIASTVDRYKYYLRHYTIHNEETVLFATPAD